MDERESAVVRESVLALLQEFCCPLSTAELSVLVRARDGLEVSPGEIEELVELDKREFDAVGDGAGVWLCPGPEPPDLYPDTDFLTRSDWPLPIRLVDFTSETKRRLWLLRMLADQVLVRLGERGDPAVFGELFADLVSTLPAETRSSRLGQAVRVDVTDEDRVEAVRELAEDEYALLANPGAE
ncbi:hypothetical protein [Amycolatopsis sp. NPDC004079]|uniref:hypothetical protein n=1 Tax=Amycolatopsis sp. NPDC004079 TaxID=3154549 RepID=UPI0033B4CC6D